MDTEQSHYMTLREDPGLLGFRDAAASFCELLLTDRLLDSYEEQLLAGLSAVYAAAYRLPKLYIHDETPELPSSENLQVTRQELDALSLRLKERFGSQDPYWAYLDPHGFDGLSDESVMHMLSEDLAEIYRDLVPGLRAWEIAGEDLLPSIAFSWSSPSFGTHWGAHAVAAMKALHVIVHRGH